MDLNDQAVKTFFNDLLLQMVEANSSAADIRIDFNAGGSASFRIELTHIGGNSVSDDEDEDE